MPNAKRTALQERLNCTDISGSCRTCLQKQAANRKSDCSSLSVLEMRIQLQQPLTEVVSLTALEGIGFGQYSGS